MKKCLILGSFSIFCMTSVALRAEEGTENPAKVEAKPSVTTVDECSRELLLAYFPAPFVRETLKKFKVPEMEWSKIESELASKDKETLKIVEQKAAAMETNPLKDPSSRQMAVKLFRETLLEEFSSVLKTHGVSDDKQIQEMLADVQQQKAERFAKCMKQEKAAE